LRDSLSLYYKFLKLRLLGAMGKFTSLHCTQIIVSIFAVFFFLFPAALSAYTQTLSIKGDNVHLRTGPGTQYKIKWEYGDGFPVEVVERQGEWVKTKDFEGDTGWIHDSLLVNIAHAVVKANKNKDENINIRNGPGSDYEVIGKAYYGVVFKVLQHQSGWVEVQHESGLKGWVSSNLLWGH